MKSQNKKIPLLFLAIGLVMLAGCLKDKDFNDGAIQSVTGNSPKVISLGVQVSSVANFTSIAYDASPNDTTVDFLPVELGGSTDAPEDVHVTIAQADTLVDNYNADPDNAVTDYVVPTDFTIVSNVVTIKKGTRIGYLQIKFIPNNYVGQDIAIGFRVASVAEAGYTISGNVGTGIIAIVIKNKYDGLYTLRQQSIGWAAYGISDGPVNQWPTDVGFFSTGGASNIFNTAQTGSAEMGFSTAGGLTSFGATEPQFTFDPNTNLLTSVVNLVPDDGRGRVFTLNPSVTDSRYDPTSKTLYIAYLFKQNGRPDQQIYDTLTYNGPR